MLAKGTQPSTTFPSGEPEYDGGPWQWQAEFERGQAGQEGREQDGGARGCEAEEDAEPKLERQICQNLGGQTFQKPTKLANCYAWAGPLLTQLYVIRLNVCDL